MVRLHGSAQTPGGLKLRFAVCVFLAALIIGCGSQVATAPSASPQQSSSSPTPASTPSPEIPSPSPCAGEAPAAHPSPGWLTYSSTEWCYSVDYPASWYDLPNFGAPDTEKYFSNENAGSPLQLTNEGIFLSISVRSAPCWPVPVYYRIDGEAVLTVAGQTVTRTYGYLAPSGAENAWTIHAAIAHGSNCYAFDYITVTQSARDKNLSTADQMITTFQVT